MHVVSGAVAVDGKRNASRVTEMPKKIFLISVRARYLTAVGALLLGLTQISNARADPASCLAKASLFVTELDELPSKEKNWITPYEDLNERYFPLRDCEPNALLDVCQGLTLHSIDILPRPHESIFHSFLKRRCASELLIPGLGEEIANGFHRIYPKIVSK
jgi:hypothetical protein